MKDLNKREQSVLDLLYTTRPSVYTSDDLANLGYKNPALILDKLMRRGLLTLDGMRYRYREFE